MTRQKISGWGGMRVLEVAGRHLNFTRAAQELHVTPAAVSHQIAELEKQLGFKLFNRTSRRMALTSDGEILFAAVSEAVDGIQQSILHIRNSCRRRRLRVTVSPTFAARWLVPRLERFTELVPDVDVLIAVGRQEVDFLRNDFDVAIRFGSGRYPEMVADRLFEETIFPVCSPILISRKPLREPNDVLDHILIHVDWKAEGETWPDWQAWLTAAGVRDRGEARGLHFQQATLAIEAAVNGHGIALGESTVVADDIMYGRLVKPFEVELKSPLSFAYYVLCPTHKKTDELVDSFRDWILNEAGPRDRKSKPYWPAP